MGKKNFEDGAVPEMLAMREIVDKWAADPVVIQRLVKGCRILTTAAGKPTAPASIQATLDNIAANAEVLQPLALQMRGLHRLSAYPIDYYQSALRTFYDRHRHLFAKPPPCSPVFNPESWGLEEGWVIHKMFSRLRCKVLRPEQPREPCSEAVICL